MGSYFRRVGGKMRIGKGIYTILTFINPLLMFPVLWIKRQYKILPLFFAILAY